MSNLIKQLEENNKWMQELKKEQEKLVYEGLHSTDPHTLIKANEMMGFLSNANKEVNTNRKTYTFDPQEVSRGSGYRDKKSRISYQALRNMSKVPLISAIIGTRIDQVAEFARLQENKYETGFVLKKKGKSYDDLSKSELNESIKISEMLMNCGVSYLWNEEDFESFIRKITKDSLIYDQMNFEIVSDRSLKVREFVHVDASTIRRIDQNTLTEKDKVLLDNHPYFPNYVQIYQDVPYVSFLPWELCFGVRNHQTDILSNGYGESELEVLIKIVTYMLFSDQHNGAIFSNGGNPKGFFLTHKANPTRLEEFRQNWMAMLNSAHNSYRIPIVDAEKFEWVDLVKSNRDMEFTHWNEYLIKIACAVYRIDPSEVGFHLSGSANHSPMFEGNNEARLKYSKDKGLRPLLRFLERKINKYIIKRNFPEWEFDFVGLDAMTEKEELELDKMKVETYEGYRELRKRKGLNPDLDPEDALLNPQYMQHKSAQQMGSVESNQAIDNEDPSSAEEGQINPIYKAFLEEYTI